MKMVLMKSRVHTRIALLALAALLLFFTACSEKSKAPDGSVLRVGDVYINQSLLDEFTVFMLNIYSMSQMMDYDTSVNDSVIENAKVNVLDLMAETESLKLFYKDVPDVIPDLTEELAKVKEEMLALEDVSDRFAKAGVTDASFIYYLETTYLHEYNGMIASDGGTYPSEADIESFYEGNMSEFYTAEQRQASHILFDDADHTAEQKTLAEETREKILSGEANFEDLAAEYNSDDSAEHGGDLGYAGKGELLPEFENALFSMKVGDLSDIVETQYGYHIIKLTDIQAESYADLDEVKEDIKAYLTSARETDAAKEILTNTDVEYLSDKYPSPENRIVEE